ncbi:MBL fold metallo-hydrolase [Aestuariibacter halophilus]|uniref:MBL fold metallo-hydrolase n=1 Tax=Fluctibacter halophilus TaxID=226011 RepID=A0ABS8G4F9_9ALTE|nr:MBL fold metallo-hydrolase [Aestuariibacter halophilus]MCC2615011.1 MBL fold metallo-hydrolase [Aestuariibacter halophilus]
MKIRHFLYNSFLIENSNNKIAIDPGQNLWIFNLSSLIPKAEWKNITHILITHGDPDHYWQADRVAQASHAPVVCGKDLAKVEGGETLLVNPRGRGLTSWVPFKNVHPLDIGESVSLGDVQIEALKTVHGPISVPILCFKIKQQPGPGERVGIGSVGFKITVDGKTIVNLGDSVLQTEWAGLKPDVLMLPIGGPGNNTWTMDVYDALEAVKIIAPKKVIPCHYNVAFFWIKNIACADDQLFKREVEKLGIECSIMRYGDEIEV